MEREEKWCWVSRTLSSFGDDSLEKIGTSESDKEVAWEKLIKSEDRFEVPKFWNWFIVIINFNNYTYNIIRVYLYQLISYPHSYQGSASMIQRLQILQHSQKLLLLRLHLFQYKTPLFPLFLAYLGTHLVDSYTSDSQNYQFA